ncbi:MAG: alpha-L-fucosidase [Armatimonadota bacterium]
MPNITRRSLSVIISALITVVLITVSQSAVFAKTKTSKSKNVTQEKTVMSSHRAKWMADGSYGMMVHYLITPSGSTPEEKTADLNRIIDGFDLDFFMKQFEESGAGWMIFTIGQNTGYYNNPNSVIDGIMPGRTPKRDLVVEIAQRVKKLGKRFIAYLPVEMWIQQPDMQNAFHWNPDDQSVFLKTYLPFMRDYSIRLGKNCDGWWFDGCYPEIHKGKWGWENWICSARAGNPDSIIAFNDGAFCVGRIKPVTPLQDYHAGEVHLLENGKIRIDPLNGNDNYVTKSGKVRRPNQKPQFHMPESQYIDGVQWHALVPVDSSFAGGIPMEKLDYTHQQLTDLVSKCKAVKGAVTFNVPLDMNGHIPEHSASKLKALGEALSGK